MAYKILTLRLEENMLYKLRAIASYERRSANGQIMVLIRDCVNAFEQEHGKIAPPDADKTILARERQNLPQGEGGPPSGGG